MTQSLHSTKTEAEAHLSGPQDDDLRQRMSEVELALEVLVDVEATHDWLRPNDLCRDARRKDWCRDGRRKEVKANLQHISELCRDGEAYRAERQAAERQRRAPPSPLPDGLRTKAEAAAKLGCSIKTLNGHVESGALRYVPLGHGKKRVRRMFTDAYLNEFIANQTRKDTPCPSIRTRTVARHTSSSTSSGEVIGFTALQKRRRDAKPKR